MSQFDYTEKELQLNKVLKMNQERSSALLSDSSLSESRKAADENIETSFALLAQLNRETEASAILARPLEASALNHPPILEDWEDIIQEAKQYCPNPVTLEDLMSEAEIDAAFRELDEIEQNFSKKTGIINRTDLSFLAIATALQVVKSLIFPHIAHHFQYGESFDPAKRLAHNDKSIEAAHRKANDSFRDKGLKKHETGRWIELLYRTPPYDITKGSKELGINMGGQYHRMYTLGHDPVLGWLFGTMNILTDVITLNSFRSFRVARNPMRITSTPVSVGQMTQETYEWIRDDYLNLPAALFAQAQHLKSDEYTKLGLPVPILPVLNENFASKLYRSNYDALCFARDAKIVGVSFLVSKIFDLIISLTHGLFRPQEEDEHLYEVRTRKILLLSNSIASTSTIINTGITSNPKNLDIGSLLNTITHLFTDIRFITRVRQEFIQSEISHKILSECQKVDCLYAEL